MEAARKFQKYFLTVDRMPIYCDLSRSGLDPLIRELPQVWIFDNDDLLTPFRQVAVFENGQRVSLNAPEPVWLTPLLA